MTIKEIKEFYESTILTKKTVYEFMDHPGNPGLLKEYKYLMKILLFLPVPSVICMIVITIRVNFSYIPFITLFILLLMLAMTGRRFTDLFKRAELLNGKTLEYSRSEKLILYCKNILLLDYTGIQKLIEDCEKKGNIKAKKLAFIAYFGVLLTTGGSFIGIIIAVRKEEILTYSINTGLCIVFFSFLWLVYSTFHSDIMNKESNTYRHIAELLKEINYSKKKNQYNKRVI